MAKSYVLSTVVSVLDKATAPLQKIGRGFGVLSASMSGVSEKLDNAGKKVGKIGEGFEKVGSSMMKGLTLPILTTGIAALKVFGDMEKITMNLATMMNGDEVAARSFAEALNDFGDKSGYSMKALADSAQTMMSFGMSANETKDTIFKLGDVARGSDEKMLALSESFAKMKAEGTLTTRTFMGMANSGFNPLLVISQKTGLSMKQLKEAMNKGQISTEMVAKAFEIATAKGGMFYKGQERANKSLPVLFSMLASTGEDALRTLGEVMKDSLNLSENIPKIAERVSKLTERFRNWAKENPALAKVLIKTAIALAAIGPATFALGKLMTTFSTLASITRNHPLLLLVAAIAWLVSNWSDLSLGQKIFAGVAVGITALAVAIYALAAAKEKLTSGSKGKILDKILDVGSKIGGEKTLGKALSIGTKLSGIGAVASLATMTGEESDAEKAARKAEEEKRNPAGVKQREELNRRIEQDLDPSKIISGTKNRTEIVVKVEAERGTTAKVDKVKSKGPDRPDITSDALVGPTLQYGY